MSRTTRRSALLRLASPLLVICLGLATVGASASPHVFWASDPIRPGETVLLRGADFGDKPVIEVARLADDEAGFPASKAPAWPGSGVKADARQASDKSVKFAVPTALAAGVFAYRLTGTGGSVVGLLNRPAVWWVQGDTGLTASPGGWLRLFGKNLAWDGKTKTTVRLQGPRALSLTVAADAYGAKLAVPKDLPPGDYQVFLHSGRGGAAGWSEPVKVTIAKPAAWPQTVYNVKESGADGTGAKDDTEAVQAALDKAKAAGGGIVYFPRGRYQLTATLRIPRFTVLRGEGETLVSIFWPDTTTPPNQWLAGTNSFGLENFTLYCGNYKTLLTGDTRGADAGDVFLRRVRIRANIYRGHMEPQEVDRRYKIGVATGFGGGYFLVTLGGKNIEVSDCDLYSSSCILSLTEPRGTRIQRNVMGDGRWGGSGIFGGEGIIIEGNQYVGCDLMSWGAAGGLGYGNLGHVYIGHNSFTLEHGGDREPITSDASGEVYHGPLAGGDVTSITLPKEPKDKGQQWIGSAVYVVSGRGEGQWRRIAGFDGARIKVDRPWDVVPDATSSVAVTWLLYQYLINDNDFSDTGMAIQLYGAAIEHICANNRSTRTAGYHNFGMNYNGVQPSWFVQWFDNEILEGNIYSADHDNHRLSGEAHIGVYGLIGGEWKLPIVLGSVIRRNILRNNASIVLGTELPNGKVSPGTRTDPLVTDVVAENNVIENVDTGIYQFQTTRGVWLTGNQFRNVGLKLWDETAVLRGNEARRQALLASVGPIAIWDFDKAVASAEGVVRRVPDATGNGFDAAGTTMRVVAEGRRGKAGQFTGDGYLSVNEPGLFNLQSVTLGLWVKPETVQGRHGLIGKRFEAAAAPYIISIWDGALEFEGNDENDKWSFNFRTGSCMKAGEWQHIAAVVEEGKGVTLYVNGQVVGQTTNKLKHTMNGEPLIIGREAWCGRNLESGPPAFYKGLMSEVKVWARALTADEVKAEAGK